MASLLPHLRISLLQQKIDTQEKALEIMMRLHASPIQDTNLGVQYIHSQLANLHLELQSLKKDKETKLDMCAKFWCLKCKGHGHDKDNFPMFANYITWGANSPEARSPSKAKHGGRAMVCHFSSYWAICDG